MVSFTDTVAGNEKLTHAGAGAVAQDKAKGYYYGGWLTSSSVPGFGSEPVPLANMLEFDMLKSSFRNQSGPDSIRRAEGVMLYVPAGDSGMLVYFGGLEFPNEKNLTEVEGVSKQAPGI